MKVQAKELKESEKIKILDTLYTAAGTVKGRVGAKQFLRDVLTESERIMVGRRIMIARALLMGKTYDEIVEEYGVGKDTIRRISHWLDDQLPGYETIIEDLETELKKREEDRMDKKLFATSALYRLKKKYPMHFLLFPGPKSK